MFEELLAKIAGELKRADLPRVKNGRRGRRRTCLGGCGTRRKGLRRA